jgi:hypothetical protein
VGKRESVVVASVLLCCSGLAHAAPESDDERAPQEVWGDPEDQEEAEDGSGWTWFGMGYERRSRLRLESSEGLQDSVHEPGNGAGNHGK